MATGIALRSRRERGFTLAEILVTTAIFAIIMIAALAVYDRSNKVFKSSAEAADLQQSTRIGFEKLVSDVRMAGFDYSRGGIPTGDGQAPQPDEQIEYAGTNAIVFRANFNYNTASSTGNGLEPAYTPVNVKNAPIFPYVTTSNDEIIAYVLRSNDSTKNTGAISFYVDDYKPRAAFPSTITPAPAGSNPSHPEEAVTIGGIDPTNDNPPYTLYRVTVSDLKANPPSLGTPVAENIRSLNFSYFTDMAGTKLLTNADGTDIVNGRNAGGGQFSAAGSGAIGGDGQYDPDNVGTTNNFTDRSQRALISSIRVNLVGMNANPDGQYQSPTETITTIQNYREYALQALVVPRNLGLTGFPEPNFQPPGPPSIIGMCTGHCGAPVIYWAAPTTAGDVTKYRVEWDTSQTGAFANGVDINDPTATSAILPDDGVSDVSQIWWYRMWSYNDNGRSVASSNYWSATPTNRTKPAKPSGLTGVTGLVDQIPLSWVAPSNNASPLNMLSCNGQTGSNDGSVIPSPQEIVKYRVWRGTDPNFNPDNGEGIQVLGFTSASQPPVAAGGATVPWVDTGLNTASAAPPANCTNYYYRVRAVDRCYKQPNWNTPNDPTGVQSMSDWFPPIGQSAMGPYQSTYSGAAPAPPPTLNVDKTTPNASGCPDPTAPLSTNCRITLEWNKSNSDTATPANPIGVDWYVITRASRVQQSGGAFVADTSFGTNGQREINCSTGVCPSGYSQSPPSAQATFVDTPPMYTSGNAGGQVLEYQYTVGAKNCSLYSGNTPNAIAQAALSPNPSVIYPGCSINPTIVEVGATNPTASGNSPQQAWILNSGDTVTVTPAQGTNTQSVKFDLFNWPAMTLVNGMSSAVGAPGNSPAINPTSYVWTYSDQIDNQIYMLRIEVNILDAQNNPCTEVHVKYIQDQQAAPCFFANVTPPAPVPNKHGNNPETDTVTLTLTNSGTEPMLFTPSGTIQPQITLVWHSPDLPNHTDMQLTDIAWGGAVVTTTSLCTYNGTCTTIGNGSKSQPISFPSALTSLAAGASETIRFSFSFDGTGQKPSLPSSPSAIVKVCITYRIASETVAKNCNLVGQAVSTLNPTNCD